MKGKRRMVKNSKRPIFNDVAADREIARTPLPRLIFLNELETNAGLEAHYFSDVLGAIVVGVTWLSFCAISLEIDRRYRATYRSAIQDAPPSPPGRAD